MPPYRVQARKSDDPSRPYDLTVDMEKGGRAGEAEPTPSFPTLEDPLVTPASNNGPSDMELLMAEFVRLDVDSDEVLDAIQGVLDNDQEGESGMRVIYDMLVSGMQRCGPETASWMYAESISRC